MMETYRSKETVNHIQVQQSTSDENPHSDIERTITMENAITLKSLKK
jgi:hypothetical protein